ncbi:MAG TPA: glycoside hydrolase family 88 protein [Candidatus Polarisedimenticolia bacterium]|nr:glycoside hydrolase family 88 protein [Candidatus Polarisedimenticolia bacterium]
MKNLALLGFLAVVTLTASAQEQVISRGVRAAELSPSYILDSMKKVADWQLTNGSPSDNHYTRNGWTWAAFYDGVMALDSIAGTPKYHDAMVEVGKKFDWQPAKKIYFADDQAVGQMYLELYMKDHDPAMLKPIQDRFDYILAHPSSDSLDFKKRGKEDRYWWCDSLFMGPPVWARLYKATGEKKYLDFMDKEWWAASDFLYDTNEHLFFRDSRYFTQKEANGKKVFWSRGNGWVMGGLVRVLEMMPADYPSRPRYEKQFKEMAEKVASVQQPDGLWHASLLDPASYPLKETSGSGFYVFAMTWGINHGLLDRATYEPVVQKGWVALEGCVTPEGKLGYAQQVGADPKSFKPDDYEVYSAGAFLLAGKEMYVLEHGKVK